MPTPKKLTGRLGLSAQNDPRNANSFVLRVEALLSGIVLGGQTQSLREFEEWAIDQFPILSSVLLVTMTTGSFLQVSLLTKVIQPRQALMVFLDVPTLIYFRKLYFLLYFS